jgi:hypothetical protein
MGSTVASAQGPPIHTDTPIMLGIQGRGARTFLRVVRKDKLLRDGEEIPDPRNRTTTSHLTPLAVPYNLATTFQVGVLIPFLTRNLESTAGDQSNTGLGDVSVFAKKLIVQVDRKQETFRVAVKGIVKFPTGDRDSTPALGTGSFDFGATTVAGWIKGRWGLYGEGIYFHNTSSGDVDHGDRFGYNAAVGFRALPVIYERYPSPQLNVYLELNGTIQGRTEIGGAENPDSGGAELLLAPGLQFVGGRRWLVEGSVQVPIMNDPNGTQLATAWTATIGARVLLF